MLTANAIDAMRETYKPIEVAELETILEKHSPKELISYKTDDENFSATTISQTPVKPSESPSKASNTPSATIYPTAIESPLKSAKMPLYVDAPAEDTDDDFFTARDIEIFAKTCPTINLDIALQYCMDSKSFLIQLLETFCEDEKSEKLQAVFDSRDIKNYQILVHGLKSTSLLIGAENLSEEAKALELAAKANDLDKILDSHEILMTNYAEVRKQISKWLEGES